MVSVVIRPTQPLYQVQRDNYRIGKYAMAEELLVVRGVEPPETTLTK